MPLHALALVLTAALLHALWNLAAKKWGGGPHFVFTCALGVTVLWLPAVPARQNPATPTSSSASPA